MLCARAPLVPAPDDGLTGAHEPAGIFVAAGAGIAPRGALGPAPIEAVGPAVLYLLDLPIPDGRTRHPSSTWSYPRSARRPVRHEPDRDPEGGGESGWRSDADRARAEAQLRALGYVE